MKACRSCKAEKPLTAFYARSATCKTCSNTQRKQDYADNQSARRERARQLRLDKLDKYRARDKANYAANPEKRRATTRAWRKANPDKVRSGLKRYGSENKHVVYEVLAKRRAAKRNAVPPWLTKEQRKEIRRIYATCQAGHHVDHVVPLSGRDVCGLHVPWNLQHLPAYENLSKGNRMRDGDLSVNKMNIMVTADGWQETDFSFEKKSDDEEE